VSLSPTAPQTLFCLECLLEINDDSIKPSIIKFNQFFDKIREKYQNEATPRKLTGTPPPQFFSLLGKKDEVMAKLTDHIEGQKS